MSQELTHALRTEISLLEDALEADIRFVRLRELRRVLALYEVPTLSTTDMDGRERRVASGRRPSAETEKILALARLFVTNRAQPVPTRVILDHLEKEGVVVGGNEPVNTLSAMLSNSDIFRSNGRAGWIVLTSALQSVAKMLAEAISRQELEHISIFYSDRRLLPTHISEMLVDGAKQRFGLQLDDKDRSNLYAIFEEMARERLQHAA